MADVFLGSLMLVPYNFAPYGYAFCQGQILPISQYAALFSLLGTYYGGDGKSNFALPNLPGCLVVSQGNPPGLSPYSIGESGGSPTVTLTSITIPSHAHGVAANASPRGLNQPSPVGNSFVATEAKSLYSNTATNLVNLSVGPGGSLAPEGKGQPHNNMMPYLTLNWIIALQGIFPARN
jgi:microcystin-dependent protein